MKYHKDSRFSSSIFSSMHTKKKLSVQSYGEKSHGQKTLHSYFLCVDCYEADFNPPSGVSFINTQQDTTGTHMLACKAVLSSAEE